MIGTLSVAAKLVRPEGQRVASYPRGTQRGEVRSYAILAGLSAEMMKTGRLF